MSLCHVTDSIYLLAIWGKLIVWNDQTEQKLFNIRNDTINQSIKRVMNSNKFIIKTIDGVKLLAINDLKSSKYSLRDLFYNRDVKFYYDSLGLQTSESHIIIAATETEDDEEGKFEYSIQVVKKSIAEVLGQEEQASLADCRDPEMTKSNSVILK
jgi:hypothetical protein